MQINTLLTFATGVKGGRLLELVVQPTRAGVFSPRVCRALNQKLQLEPPSPPPPITAVVEAYTQPMDTTSLLISRP